MKSLQLCCLGTLAFGVITLRADVVFTIEAPGVQETSVVGALTETFDSPEILGTTLSGYSAANGGTYTGGAIVPGTTAGGAFGGADESSYLVIGLQPNFPTATATFDNDLTYFGMWWPAGDAANVLRFYQDDTLLNTFLVSDLLEGLGDEYFGNPNNGLDPNEPFVYLNFTGTGSTRFNRIEFSNTTTSGFETDNHSTFDQPISPPGIPIVPDLGSSAVLLALGLGLLGVMRRVD